MKSAKKHLTLVLFFSFLAIQNCDLVCAFSGKFDLGASQSTHSGGHCDAGKTNDRSDTHCGSTNKTDKAHDRCGCSSLNGNPSITSAAQFLTRPPLSRSLALPVYLPLVQNLILRRQASNIAEHGPPSSAGSEIFLSFRSPRAPPLSQSL